MLNQETGQKILDKIEPLIGKAIAILDENKKVLVYTSDFYDPKARDNIVTVKAEGTLPKKTLNIKEKGIPINAQSKRVGYLYVEEKSNKVKELHDVLKSMTEMYLDQLALLEKIPAEERYLDKFLYDLLAGKEDIEVLRDQADVFGIDLDLPRVVITLLIDGENKEILEGTEITGEEKENLIRKIRKNISMAVDSFYTNHKDNIVGYVGDNIFVILKDLGEEGDVKENIKHFKKTIDSLHYVIRGEVRCPITIGVGGHYQGSHGLGESFGEALLTAHLGEDLWGGDGIYHFDSFGVIAPLLMGKDEKVGNFSKDFFSKFSNKTEVIKTLNTFFETDMSLTETAKKLKIHRNTLVYRLDKINEVLKLDPRVFDDAVQIKLAILFNNFMAGEAI